MHRACGETNICDGLCKEKHINVEKKINTHIFFTCNYGLKCVCHIHSSNYRALFTLFCTYAPNQNTPTAVTVCVCV